MILTVVLSPRIFDLPPGAAPNLFYPLVIGLLRDLEENCVILVDDEPDRVTTSGITEAVNRWPITYRPQAKEILSRLRTRMRFVKAGGAAALPTCGNQPCRLAMGIAIAIAPDAVIVSSNCETVISAAIQNRPVVTPESYIVSPFAVMHRELRAFRIPNGGWTVADFEKRILVPVLRHASHVTIVDRYIGRSVVDNTGAPASLGVDYQRSLDWFCDTYARLAAGNAKATVEIWAGLDMNQISETQAQAAGRVLRQWEAAALLRGVPKLKLHLKRETYQGGLPHARYLITDQVALLIERGFDILFSDSQMRQRGLDPNRDDRPVRDAAVVLMPNSRDVTTELRRLTDV